MYPLVELNSPTPRERVGSTVVVITRQICNAYRFPEPLCMKLCLQTVGIILSFAVSWSRSSTRFFSEHSPKFADIVAHDAQLVPEP